MYNPDTRESSLRVGALTLRTRRLKRAPEGRTDWVIELLGVSATPRRILRTSEGHVAEALFAAAYAISAVTGHRIRFR